MEVTIQMIENTIKSVDELKKAFNEFQEQYAKDMSKLNELLVKEISWRENLQSQIRDLFDK